MNPIDIIAAALRRTDDVRDDNGLADRARAGVAVDALTDERIVAVAVQALKADGWEETHEGPLGIGTLSDQDLANIARAVLRAVGGAR